MWNCPSCGTRVEASFEVCWNCGTARDGTPDPTFIRADDSGPIEDEAPAVPKSPEGELVEAYRALDLMEAQFLVEQLEGQGIAATADTQDFHDALASMTSGPRVWVLEANLPRARAWLATYEAGKHHPGGR